VGSRYLKKTSDYKGYVYNLETTLSYYIANGIATHNCECTWVLKTKPRRRRRTVEDKIQADYADMVKFTNKTGKEIGGWYDASGKRLIYKKGTKNHISLTQVEDYELRFQAYNNPRTVVATHTHPYPEPLPFSGDDLAHSAYYKLKESRVLTNKGTFVIKPKGENWPSHESLKIVYKKYKKEFRRKIYDNSEIFNKLGIHKAWAKTIDETIKAVARDFDLDYKFIPYKGGKP